MKVYAVEILSFAYNDIELGRDFYNLQAENLGSYFTNSILTDIDSLSFYAGIHSKTYGFYRLLAKRFPYSIYYDIQDGIVFVYAVLDQRRNPLSNIKQLTHRR